MASALAAALVAAASPATAAKLPPPFSSAAVRAQIQVLRIHDERSRTCSARAPRKRAGTVERQLNPVACEQPPRSRVGVVSNLSGGLGSLFGR
jgi:hypothetical protein